MLSVTHKPTEPKLEQTIAAATGTCNPYVDVCYIAYTDTGAVTDVELDATWIGAKSCTTFIDADSNAGKNNITIKNTADDVIAVIAEDCGSVTIKSNGSVAYIA